MVSEVSLVYLLSLVEARLRKIKSAEYDEKAISDAIKLLPDLASGMTVNVKFTRINDFELWREHVIFDLLNIPLYHGWIVDPQDLPTSKVIGSKSYEELQVDAISEQGELITGFLNSSQLTTYGLLSLQEGLKEHELCVFYCNFHFNTMYKFEDELYMLATDQGFLGHSHIWEKLDEVNGDTHFVGSNFKPVIHDTAGYIGKMDNADTTSLNSDLQLEMKMQQLEFKQPEFEQQQQQQQPHRVLPPSPTTSRSALVVGPQVKFTVDELQSMMDVKHNIRNMSMIGHFNHGKSTMTHYLVAAAGIIAPEDVASDVGMRNTHPYEAERGITTKLSSTYLHYKSVGECKEYLLNLIDTPGHADFSSEVNAALRITDGALVVVDCIEGVCVQTETVLRQALAESVHPVLTVNKMDRLFLKLKVDNDETAYMMLKRVIDSANVLLDAYKDPHLGDVVVSPEKGTVAFSSGVDGWAFTLTAFARMYAPKFDCDESEFTERLWGDNFYDSKTNKWTTKHTGAASCARGFVKFCYAPLKEIIEACLNGNTDFLWDKLKYFNVTMKSEEKLLRGEALMKCVMQNWLPAAPALLEMSISHLPSPHAAQRYRVKNLYTGQQDDQYAASIRDCEPEPAHLLLYVSKMIRIPDKGGFFAFGRVFSGRVRKGSRVRIMGPNAVASEEFKTVERTAIWMGKNLVTMESVPCGNTVALFGLDGWIAKNATLTTEEGFDADPICAMKFSVASLVGVTVGCSDILKLRKGLKRLVESDASVVFMEEKTGFLIAGTGELHLKTCKKELEAFMGGAEINFSEPFVSSYRETVLENSPREMTKKRNKCFYMEARRLEDGVVEAIEDGEVGPSYFPMDILCFGPNLLAENTGGVGYSNKIKALIVDCFKDATEKGYLAEEKMRGILFKLLEDAADCEIDEQIVRKAIHEAQHYAKPRLLEPYYFYEVLVSVRERGGVYDVFNERGGRVFSDTRGHPYYCIRGYIPIRKSFGFSEDLKTRTCGIALVQCLFDHWDSIQEDQLDHSDEECEIVAKIRERKGLGRTVI